MLSELYQSASKLERGEPTALRHPGSNLSIAAVLRHIARLYIAIVIQHITTGPGRDHSTGLQETSPILRDPSHSSTMPTDGRPVLVPIGTPSAVVTTPRVGAETMTVT